MRPAPAGSFGDAGETISGGVSRSLKKRSLDAIADCRMLYFSLRSWMVRKKRCAYCMNATSTPRVTRLRMTWPPPNHTCLLYTSDAADEEDSVDLGGRRIIKKKK